MGTRVSMMLSALTYTLYMSQVTIILKRGMMRSLDILENTCDISTRVYKHILEAVVPEQLLHLRGFRPTGSGWSDHLDGPRHLLGQQLEARDNHQAPSLLVIAFMSTLPFFRNSAIFWAMSMSSLLIGNLQCFFMFQGEEYITSATRNTLGVILIVVSGLGTALMFGLRPPPSQSQDEVSLDHSSNS